MALATMGNNVVLVKNFALEVYNKDLGKMFKYCKLIIHPKYKDIWMHSSANEFGRLAQGVGDQIQGTNTIFFSSTSTKCHMIIGEMSHMGNMCVRRNQITTTF